MGAGMSTKTTAVDRLADGIQGWVRRTIREAAEPHDRRLAAAEADIIALRTRLDQTEATLRAIRQGARDDD